MAGGKRRNLAQIAPSTASRQDGTPIAPGSGGGGGGGAPAAHAATHQNSGSDEVNVAGLSGVLADPQPPIIGAGAAQAVAGNDARLTNARTPTAHHATHEAGGSDPVVLAAADLSNGVTGSGAVVLAVSPALTTNPTAPTQAASDSSTKIATTAFVATAVANAVAGVNPAVAVEAATAAVLQDAPTYANGVGGVGATLTAGSLNTTLMVDGYTPALNDRLLVKNQASAFQNGVYVVTQLGAIGLAWILMRAADFNSPSDMNDTGAIPVINGTVNLDTSWVLTSHVTTVGTDALTFTKFSINPTTIVTTARQVISGGGLTGGGDLSADRTLAVGAGTGITVNADDVAVNQTVLKLDDWATPDDNTDLNVSTTKHGLAPKLPNDVTKFFNGTGGYTVPTTTEQSTSATGTQNNFDLNAHLTCLRCDGAAPVFTGFTVLGAAPTAGDRVIIENIGTGTVRVAYQDTGSTAAHRIVSPSIRGQIIGVSGTITLVYDGTTSRWRVTGTEPGAPIAIAFSAGNFTGGGSSTWTVDSGDVLTNAYLQEGTKLTWFFTASTMTLGGTPATFVNIALPNGFTVANNGVQVAMFGRYFDAATWLTMFSQASNTTSTVLTLASLAAANLASGTNSFYIQGMASFLVD